jgi:hypothetical protein
MTERRRRSWEPWIGSIGVVIIFLAGLAVSGWVNLATRVRVVETQSAVINTKLDDISTTLKVIEQREYLQAGGKVQ